MSRPKVDKVFRTVAMTAGGLLFGMAMVLATGGYWNIKGDSASATVARLQEDYTKSPLSVSQETSETEVELNLNSVASLAVTDVDMNVKPGGDNVFVTGASEVWAMVKADAGYTILMSAEDSTLDNEESEATVPTISSNTTGSNMPASSWGYHVGEVSGEVDNADDKALIYKPIPSNNNSVTLSDWNGDSDNYTGWEIMDLGYGVNVAPTLESGSYTRTVTITAVGKMYSATLRVYQDSDGVGSWTHDGVTYTGWSNTVSIDAGVPVVIEDPVGTVKYEYGNYGQGATIDTTGVEASPRLTFTGWENYDTDSPMTFTQISGNNTYKFNRGETLRIRARYEEKSITLPTVTKQGHNCGWTYSQSGSSVYYSNGSSQYVSNPTKYYTVCTAKTFTANIQTAGTGSLTRSSNSISVPYGGTATVNITPFSTKITGASCTNGYTVSPAANNQIAATTFTIHHPGNGVESTTTCTFTGEANETNSFVDVEYMQDVESCPATKLTDGTQYTLKDSRDEKEYKVAKIGNQCWMTTNLNIAGGTELSSTNTNIPSGTVTLPASSTSGFNNDTGAFVYNDADDTGEGTGGYGGYYSYRAAVANYNFGTRQSTRIEQSICPKRWRLPTKDEFNTLRSTYNTTAKITAAPWYGKLSGYYSSSSSLYDKDRYGTYWIADPFDTSSSYRYYAAYYMTYSNYNTYGAPSVTYTNYGTHYGRSVRCIWSGE